MNYVAIVDFHKYNISFCVQYSYFQQYAGKSNDFMIIVETVLQFKFEVEI